ncbi:uncharacterized protein V6R79_003855 [Siganus canaliculatus]
MRPTPRGCFTDTRKEAVTVDFSSSMDWSGLTPDQVTVWIYYCWFVETGDGFSSSSSG